MILEHKPTSVYKFCKHLGIPENVFYEDFGTFEALESSFWTNIVSNTNELLHKDHSYAEYDLHNKLLGFYFTLFENMALYRSYIQFVSGSKKLSFLHTCHKLRSEVQPVLKTFAQSFNSGLELLSHDLAGKVSEEGLWLQFVSIFKFWLKDGSKGFESTDAFIEKSVRLSVDLSKSLPIESLLDYGKFLFKEIRS
jgi:hypothetical protein